MTVTDSAKKNLSSKRVVLLDLLLIFIWLAASFGLSFQFLHLFERFELETINHRFDTRRLIKWYPGGLARLNLEKLVLFHESHDLPNGWWRFDKTISWLVEDNHPAPTLKIICFNRLVEDEPALETAQAYPWMKPLLNYPMSRQALAKVVRFLAGSGAKAICLDYDFPQYDAGDAELARAIHDASTGSGAQRSTPVVMANTFRSVNSGSIDQLERSGVIRELQKLEPDQDVIAKYLGRAGTLQDQDQVIRRLSLKMQGKDEKCESVLVKLLQEGTLKEAIASSGADSGSVQIFPDAIDVDFIAPPNADVYPVRSLTYLLNPDLQAKIVRDGTNEPNLKDSIVILGDGISDIYNTPLAISAGKKRSGSEIVAAGLDTLARRSWIKRLSPAGSCLYVLLMALVAGLNFVLSRHLVNHLSRGNSQSGLINVVTETRNGMDEPSVQVALARRWLIFNPDVFVFLVSLLSIYVIANLLFTYCALIVPLVVPSVAITLAMLLTVLWEKDRIKILSMEEKLRSWQERLQLSQEKLVLAQEKHEAELAFQSSLTEQWAMEEDRRRRQDMIRRLNHDLKAPISVFNWTLAKLVKDKAADDPTLPVFERLKKSSDLLSNLLSEIVKSLSGEGDWLVQEDPETCEITTCLKKQAEMEMSFAEITGSQVLLRLPEGVEKVWVMGSEIEIARIVDNIVGNALKHNPPGTKVIIEMLPYQWLDEEIQISISDNGKGIAKDDLAKIFQPGFRSDGTRIEGEGLGLSIASSLAKKIEADIVVDSTIGEGTKFNIYLKRYRSEREKSGDYLVFNEEEYAKRHGLSLTAVESGIELAEEAEKAHKTVPEAERATNDLIVDEEKAGVHS